MCRLPFLPAEMPSRETRVHVRISAALMSAFLEWIMLLLLLVHAMYSYLVGEFSRLCKLPSPCLLCSQLDDVLRKNKSNICVDLICEKHRLEISSLVYSRYPSKQFNFDEFPASCPSSSGIEETSCLTMPSPSDVQRTDEVVETLFPPLEKSSLCFSKPLDSDPHNAGPFKWMLSDSKKDTTECPAELNAEGATLASSREIDCLSDVKYRETNIASSYVDQNVMGTCSCEDGNGDEAHDSTDAASPDMTQFSGCNGTQEAIAENLVVKNLGENTGVENLQYQCADMTRYRESCVVLDIHMKSEDLKLADEIATTDMIMLPESYDNKEDDAEKAQCDMENSSPTMMNSLGAVAANDDFVVDKLGKNLMEEKKEPSQPELEPEHQDSLLSEISSQQQQCITKGNYSSHMLTAHEAGANDAYPERSQSTADPGALVSTPISLSEAYDLAIGKKSSLSLPPTLTNLIVGKDSSCVHDELRLLISQLSAARGLETPRSDAITSPLARGCGDDVILQNITQRLSIERNPSGLESLDSIVSEIEGETTVDRMKRQIELDRKSISLLCKELEEERAAAAIAASQALAMITRLQEEKAAVQMEALHYQRLMEEQAEYDHETLQNSNDLLSRCEERVQQLEFELESFKRQPKKDTKPILVPNELPGGSTADAALEYMKLNINDEKEKEYIADQLRELERKLHSLSNNASSICCEKEGDEEISEVNLAAEASTQDALASFAGLTFTGTDSLEQERRGFQEEFQEELWGLERRLRTLEADHNFLEHSINSLGNGREGVALIEEMAQCLRQLREIGVRRV